jgi:hypothetical protein
MTHQVDSVGNGGINLIDSMLPVELIIKIFNLNLQQQQPSIQPYQIRNQQNQNQKEMITRRRISTRWRLLFPQFTSYIISSGDQLVRLEDVFNHDQERAHRAKSLFIYQPINDSGEQGEEDEFQLSEVINLLHSANNLDTLSVSYEGAGKEEFRLACCGLTKLKKVDLLLHDLNESELAL